MTTSIFGELKSQEARLGLPDGFFGSLLDEGDWSFVIKLNALIEAACSDALAARLHSPQLASSLSTLDLGHNKHGKVALLRTLGAVTNDQAATMQLLYELRNLLAHNIQQVRFSFESYIASLDKNQKRNFVTRAGLAISDPVEVKDIRVPRDAFILENPKLALWLTFAEILACLHLEHEFAEARLELLAFKHLRRGGAQ